MTRREALSWLFSLQTFGVKLGLDNIRALLDALGHPEHAYPCLLITGSNGKGSVAAMATAALRAAGHRVGTYTSPHLVRFGERIAVDEEPLRPERIVPLVTAVRAAIDELRKTDDPALRLAHHPTFFEVVTAMGLLEFKRARVDVAVLEVGLGGRFDATNASDPVVSVVTAVALEHTRYLGDTLEAIAFEKAGVARAGRPLVTGVARGPALRTLRTRADELGARLVVAPRVVRTHVLAATRAGLRLRIETARGRYPDVRLPLPGIHQARNAAVAVAALESLPQALRPTPRVIATGLGRTRWPGRIEYVSGRTRPRILLDGAHNPHAARALAAYLRQSERRGHRVLVFACMRDKDVTAVAAALFPLFDDLVLTTVENPRAATVEELAVIARDTRRASAAVHLEPASARALDLARALAGRAGLVVATGSLYLVGEVKAYLESAARPDQG